MPEQQLHGVKVLCAAVDQCRPGPAHRVRPVVCSVQAQLINPMPHNPGILPGSRVERIVDATDLTDLVYLTSDEVCKQPLF